MLGCSSLYEQSLVGIAIGARGYCNPYYGLLVEGGERPRIYVCQPFLCLADAASQPRTGSRPVSSFFVGLGFPCTPLKTKKGTLFHC